jgi:hypothetical protein
VEAGAAAIVHCHQFAVFGHEGQRKRRMNLHELKDFACVDHYGGFWLMQKYPPQKQRK